MAGLNKVFLLGNLTRDPELRYTSGGTAICSFGIAVNRRYRTAAGEDREETCFVDIDVFGKQAESCGNYLRRGAPALVEGRLKYDQWDDRETGKKRSRLLVQAERVQFLGAPGGRQDYAPGADRDDDRGYGGDRPERGADRGGDRPAADRGGNRGGRDYPAPTRSAQGPRDDRPQGRREPMPPFEPGGGGDEDDVLDDIPF